MYDTRLLKASTNTKASEGYRCLRRNKTIVKYNVCTYNLLADPELFSEVREPSYLKHAEFETLL